MGIFNNIGRFKDFDKSKYIRNLNIQIQGTGLKLDSNNNYDIQQRRLTNVGEGVNVNDTITRHHMEANIQAGLQTKPNRTDVILVDGSIHMTGDLDLRGNKLIFPSKIDMDRKLITNLDTDENDVLSAVNMITMKNTIAKVTKDIDLKDNFNIINSKQQSFTDLKANNDNLVSYHAAKDIFLSGKETLPMETSLDMNNNIILNVKNPNRIDQAVNKGYLDQALEQKLSNPATKDLSMGSFKITNLATPKTHENDAAINVSFFNTELNESNINLSTQLTNAYKIYQLITFKTLWSTKRCFSLFNGT